jgi:hypothetical protein
VGDWHPHRPDRPGHDRSRARCYDTRVGNVAARVANRFVLPTLTPWPACYAAAERRQPGPGRLPADVRSRHRPARLGAHGDHGGPHPGPAPSGLLNRRRRGSLELTWPSIDVVVVDKTGTLTQRPPLGAAPSMRSRPTTGPASEALPAAGRAAAQASSHPIAHCDT